MEYPIETRRHSAAHVMAAAVKQLFPEAKFGVGPVIENGFYYDIDIGRPVTPDDLKAIEKAMRSIVGQNPAFVREELPINDAIKLFRDLNQTYKVELLNDLKTKGTTKVSAEEAQDVDPQNVGVVTIYKTGEFIDLCRGPHVTEAKEIGTWKLTKIAGAYWRGKETNPQMQRIYGLCFATKKELDEYETMMVEAEKRDHRKLGKDLGLFTFSSLVGSGLPLWLPKGATVRRILERFIVDTELEWGYLHVYTPDIAKLDLYKTSGHYPYYKDSMYAPIKIDEDEFMLRPMTCPHHFQIYTHEPHSYRELPMRIAELAKLYRYEASGELSGLVRVRSFCLADAHIMCAGKEQAIQEVGKALDLIEYVAGVFGLKMGQEYSYRLSLGDRADEKKFYKNDEAWDAAEGALRALLVERDCSFVEAEHEAAFYGPKIDVQMKDVRGKENTAFTVQYDFCMPDRFDLNYTDADGKEKRVVVIHRSSIGAIERVMAFLIEHYAGAFPLWLAPVQVTVLPVADRHVEFAKQLAKELTTHGLRVDVDDSSESVGKKIREAEKQKYPRMLVVGDKEAGGGDLTVRIRGEKDQQTIAKSAFIKKLLQEIQSRQ